MLVLPSFEEGFGLPVLEAMACGVPVVVSNRGSLPEVAGDAARPIDPDDVDALAAEMARLLDPAAAAEASDRGLRRASQFTWAGLRRIGDARLRIGHRAAPGARRDENCGRRARAGRAADRRRPLSVGTARGVGRLG